MDQDEIPQEPQEKVKNPIKPFLSTKLTVLIMLIAGIILLLPLIFFVLSTLEERKIVQETTPPPKQDIFYRDAPYAEDQLIVKYKDTYTLEEILKLKNSLEGLGVISQKKVFDSESPDLKNIYLLTFEEGVDLKKAALELSKLSEIEAVGANYIIKAQESPNDPGYDRQWDLVKIQMPEAWEVNKGSNNIKVAVIDTGIDYNHQDFAGRNIIKGPDLTRCSSYQELSGGRVKCLTPKAPDSDPIDNDNRGHGTHVAGTIGAVTNNNAGVAGVNWNITLMAIKTNGGIHGDGYVDDVLEGIRYAVDNGAKVINMSLSAPLPCDNENVIGYKEALKYASDHNVTVVVAAGNGTKDARQESPGSCGGVITVGSIDANDNRAPSSNYGPKVDISAPGINILSTMPSNNYGYKNGTSMAAPHVAGVAALMLSVKPNLTPAQIKDCLIRSADPINTDQPVGPRLNAFKALTTCSNLPTQTPTPTPTQTPTPSPTLTTSPTEPGSVTAPPGSSATSTPVPAKTYTCREKTGSRSPAGTIQIGDLECVPNP